MYGFLLRPKWIAFHLLVAGSVALMVSLGFWQLRRLDERRAFNDVVAARIDEAPVPLDELLAESGGDVESIEWRPVVVTGTYLPEQVIWFNRSFEGQPGDNVLAAVTTGGGPTGEGTTVVVNRGFVALGSAVSDPPGGDVDILGRVRTSQVRRAGELTDTADGPVTEVRRVDLGVLAAQLPGDVAPIYVDLVDSEPAITPADPVPTPPPTLDEGPHLSYAFQWFIFAGCVLAGWVLAVRRSVATRRRATAGSG